MLPYSHEAWGITSTEYNRIKDAVDQNIVPVSVANGRRNELKFGLLSVDELIRDWDSKHVFLSSHVPNRSHIEQDEFEQIVLRVLDGDSDIKTIEFFKMGVQLKVYSRSHKSGWMCYLDFDDNGVITGKYRIQSDYIEATKPRFIGAKIRRAIESSLYI